MTLRIIKLVIIIALSFNYIALSQTSGVKIIAGIPPAVNRTPSFTPDPDNGDIFLRDFPAYDWSYGCSCTAAAMLLAYYDLGIYSNIYDGPSQGGLVPLDNIIFWGHGECPLSASHFGIDGRTTNGHVDDYWDLDSSGTDSFIFHGRTAHISDCVADFMGTSQNSWNVPDGGTMFYFPPDGTPIFDDTMFENSNPRYKDGCHGIRQFIESRGYAVKNNYNQAPKTSMNHIANGFSYDNFKNEIDQGRPVLLSLINSAFEGHSMVAFGYNDIDNEQWVWVHDTWDNYSHKMQWNGYYSGFNLFIDGVTVIELDSSACEISSNTNIEPAEQSTLKISHYPNPADEQVTFEYNLPVIEGYSLKIFNNTGQITEDLKITVSVGKIIWDTAKVKAGVYIFVLQNGPLSKSGKIIVRH